MAKVKKMMTVPSGWEPTTVRVETKTEKGSPIVIDTVPGYRETKTGRTFYDPDTALRMHHENMAKAAGLQEVRDFALFTMLGALAYNFQAKYTPYHYTLNKMLFYQWRRLADDDLGDAFPHDTFIADRKGPVPEHINDDLRRLEKAGLLSIEPIKGKAHHPRTVRLTSKGQDVAKILLDQTDDWFRAVTELVKTELILLTPAQLRERVHREFPDFKRDYIEVDES